MLNNSSYLQITIANNKTQHNKENTIASKTHQQSSTATDMIVLPDNMETKLCSEVTNFQKELAPFKYVLHLNFNLFFCLRVSTVFGWMETGSMPKKPISSGSATPSDSGSQWAEPRWSSTTSWCSGRSKTLNPALLRDKGRALEQPTFPRSPRGSCLWKKWSRLPQSRNSTASLLLTSLLPSPALCLRWNTRRGSVPANQRQLGPSDKTRKLSSPPMAAVISVTWTTCRCKTLRASGLVLLVRATSEGPV